MRESYIDNTPLMTIDHKLKRAGKLFWATDESFAKKLKRTLKVIFH